MVRLARRHLISVACLVVAGLVGVAAIADHHDKAARMDRAEVAEWYCAHQGTRCGGPSWQAIERHWNERQWGYEVAVTTLGVVAFIRFIYRRRS